MMVQKFLRIAKNWLPKVILLFCLGVTLWLGIQTLLGAKLPLLFGWGAAVVRTGSMEPILPVDSLIVIHATGQYADGDIVTYVDRNEHVITHRIQSISGGTVITKGDANNTEDRPFAEERIIGEVRHVIPEIGQLFLKLKHPVTIAVLIFGVIILCADSLIPQKKGNVQYE